MNKINEENDKKVKEILAVIIEQGFGELIIKIQNHKIVFLEKIFKEKI